MEKNEDNNKKNKINPRTIVRKLIK